MMLACCIGLFNSPRTKVSFLLNVLIGVLEVYWWYCSIPKQLCEGMIVADSDLILLIQFISFVKCGQYSRVWLCCLL